MSNQYIVIDVQNIKDYIRDYGFPFHIVFKSQLSGEHDREVAKWIVEQKYFIHKYELLYDNKTVFDILDSYIKYVKSKHILSINEYSILYDCYPTTCVTNMNKNKIDYVIINGRKKPLSDIGIDFPIITPSAEERKYYLSISGIVKVLYNTPTSNKTTLTWTRKFIKDGTKVYNILVDDLYGRFIDIRTINDKDLYIMVSHVYLKQLETQIKTSLETIEILKGMYGKSTKIN